MAGSVAPLAYGPLLSSLCDSGFLIVNTPIPVLDLNHGRTAKQINQVCMSGLLRAVTRYCYHIQYLVVHAGGLYSST